MTLAAPGDVPANDAPTTEHSVLWIVNVHRAALSTSGAGFSTHDLRHYGYWVCAQEESMRVVAIRGDDIVMPFADAVHPANGEGFHADVDVHVSTRLSLAVGHVALLFKVPDEKHVSVVLLEICRRF